MKINIFKLPEDASKATGLTVVIDVFRAFSTEAYIFANNAEKIIPVNDVEEALELKRKNPEYILAGERKGLKIEGFDFGNGPSEVIHEDFSGKTIVHTTSNGTKGLMLAQNAAQVIAGSFVTADSIVKYIQKLQPEEVSLVSTSVRTEEENEDVLLAYYIRDVLNGVAVDENEIKKKLSMTTAQKFLVEEAGVPQEDIDLCLDFHRFDFVIKKIADKGQLCLVKE